MRRNLIRLVVVMLVCLVILCLVGIDVWGISSFRLLTEAKDSKGNVYCLYRNLTWIPKPLCREQSCECPPYAFTIATLGWSQR